MSGSLTEYIVVGIIISVVVNIILMKVSNLIRIKRQIREEQNRPIPDNHPYRVPSTIPTHSSPSSTPVPLPAANNQNITTVNNSRSRNTPPPIPVRSMSMNLRDIYSFPRCPICRSSNRPGRVQKISWNSANSRWHCTEGHDFSS